MLTLITTIPCNLRTKGEKEREMRLPIGGVHCTNNLLYEPQEGDQNTPDLTNGSECVVVNEEGVTILRVQLSESGSE